MIVEITAIVAAIRHLLEIGKIAQDAETVDDAREQLKNLLSGLNSVLSDLGQLQADRIDALRERGELIQEIADLRTAIVELHRVKLSLEGYVFNETDLGFPLYKRRPATDTDAAVIGDEPQYICAKCYQQQKQAALYRVNQDFSGTHYKCLLCGELFSDTNNRAKMEYQTASRRVVSPGLKGY